MKKIIILLGVLFIQAVAVFGASVSISEFMAVNSYIPFTNPLDIKTHIYGWDAYPDWIELHNSTGVPVDVGGMYLTDDAEWLTQWQFPAGTTIAPNGYLIVFASGKTAEEYPGNYPYVDDWGALHTNFELASGGEYLALVESDGLTVADDFGPEYPNQRGLVSYGLGSGGTTNYLTTPTPGSLVGSQWTGAANSGTYDGMVGDTQFSVDRGFYEAAFEVFLSCDTPGAAIYFTTDSSEPIDINGNPTLTAQLYNEISNKPQISITTCLRVAAIKAGWLPSDIDTQTYIFTEDVLDQTAPAEYDVSWGGYPADYKLEDDDSDIKDVAGNANYTVAEARAVIKNALLAIPTLSVVSHGDGLFASLADGIYLNTFSEGIDWERFSSAELFDPVEGSMFQLNCGLRLQGGASRRPDRAPKHSMSLRFRGGYGPGKLDHNLFPESSVDSFNSLQLRAMYNNSWIHWDPGQRSRGSMIRDQWVRDALLDMGDSSAGEGTYVHLYLNGLYWGVYDLHERQEAGHYGTHYEVDSDTLDAISSGAAVDGNTNSWNSLQAQVANASSDSNFDLSEYESVRQKLDVTSLCDYMIANQFGANADWHDNNWRAAGGGVNDVPWHIYSWDAERIFEGITDNELNSEGSNSPRLLFENLHESDEFAMLFADRIHKHFFNGGSLTAERAAQRWMNRANELDQAVIAESARWGDYKRDVFQSTSSPYYLYTKNDHWLPEQNRLMNSYFMVSSGLNRSEEILQNQYTPLYYPSVDAPVFSINGSYQHGGYASVGDILAIINRNGIGTMYYTLDGSDPRLPGGAVNPLATLLESDGATTETVELVGQGSAVWNYLYDGSDQGTAWRQLSFSDGSWGSGIGELGFGDGDETTDIGPRVVGRMSAYFRHLFTVTNPSEITSLSINLKYDDGAVIYINDTEVGRVNMPVGTVLYNTAADEAEDTTTIIAGIDPSVLNTGSNILAVEIHQNQANSSDMSFDLGLDATVGDFSQEVLTESTPVKARVLDGSTWSALNEAVYAVGPVTNNLRVSEIMYHPALLGTEYIEVVNRGAETINLNRVAFTRGVHFTFPSLALAPGEYALVVQDLAAFEAAYDTTGLKIAGEYVGLLDNGGEKIELRDAASTVIQRFDYKDGWYEITDGQGFSLTIRDATADLALWDEKAGWRPSAASGGSPGYDDSGQVPVLGSITINEVLAHSHAIAPDWIELHNITDAPINIGGWFLSDDNSGGTNSTKYEIPLGTAIPAGGYQVFYEDTSFGDTNAPGCTIPFGLSEGGDQVYLLSGDSGQITGYVEEEDFGASESGIAFGRYYKASTDSYNFVAMSQNTPGAVNAYPKVGPIVISKIMYNPAAGGSYDNDEYEYVELCNITASPVTLQVYDALLGVDVPWKFTNGIDYTFPLGSTIPAGGRVVIAKNLAAYAERYESSADFGPYEGKLDNGGEKLDLSMPGDEELGVRYYIRVDRVSYSDGSHPVGEDPWPVEADGGGYSLDRINDVLYGNDVSNWNGIPDGTPPEFTTDPVVGIDGAVGAPYSGTLAGSATDPDVGDTLTYSKLGGPDWLDVAFNGALSGTPDVSGTDLFTVQVSDGSLIDTATLQIYVQPLGSPPVFSADPIQRSDGVFDDEYSTLLQTLAGSATDPDSDPLTYSKTEGPDWLIIAPDGALSGTPDTIGTNDFTVGVEDGNSNSDTAILKIYIPSPPGTTYFLGGDLFVASNWDGGLPAGQVATINNSGSYSGAAQNTPWLSGSTATFGGGATFTLQADFSAYGSVSVTINDATLNIQDDFFVDNGHVILNAGSTIICADDWEANDHNGRITVNGGTHSSGPNTDHCVGAQRTGTGIDFLGGTVTAGNFRFQAGSTSSVGGSAVLASAGPGTTFSDMAGLMNIASDWTGSWEVGSFGAGAWESALTGGNGFRLDGAVINAASFASNFEVSGDGTTLTIAVLPPEEVGDISISTLSGSDLEISWNGVAGHTYTLEYKSELTEPTWTVIDDTMTGTGTITITIDASESKAFYRVTGERN